MKPTIKSILVVLLLFTSVLSVSAVDVEKWHPYDLTFTSSTNFSNPYQDVSISATFSGPGGKEYTIPGFYIGSGKWKVRFAPTAVGSWSYKTSSSNAQLNSKTGSITCVENRSSKVHGGIRIDPSNKHHYRYDDGSPYLQVGYELDWLALMDFGDPNIPKAKAMIDIIANHGFTEALINIYADDTGWRSGDTGSFDFGSPKEFAWKGSNSKPDHSQMNASFFENYDRVIDYMFQKGITAHIMIKVYNKKVKWPSKKSDNDKMFFKYVVSRYQAYPNIIWDFSKEAKNEKDKSYIKNTLAEIGKMDAYDRLLTVHDDIEYYKNSSNLNSMDFATEQTHVRVYNNMIESRKKRDWPILNAEFGYEIGNDGKWTYKRRSPKEEVFKEACEILMAGGYLTYYYTYHAWDVVKYNEVPNGLKFYKNLFNLFNQTKWYSMEPKDGLVSGSGVGKHCLAKEGREYMIYLEKKGSTTLKIANVASGKSLSGKWVNMYTGAEQKVSGIGNGSKSFSNPWSDPAMLHLTTGEGGTPPTPPTPPTTVAVTGVTLSQTSFSLEVGKTSQLSATIAPANASNKSVSWSSDNNNVANVNSDGFVIAKTAGTATITVKTVDGNKTASAKITVNSTPTPPTPPIGECTLPRTENDLSINKETINYNSGTIDISCVSTVTISMNIKGVGPMENADYLNVYYKVDGGAPIAISENTDAFSSKTISATGISGKSVEIIVNGYTSFRDETYTVSNILVSEGDVTTIPDTGGQNDATIRFTKPSNNQTFNTGETVVVNVTTANNKNVAKIELYLNGAFVRQELHDSYDWGHTSKLDPVLKNMKAGTYTLKAVVTDKDGKTSQNVISVTVAGKKAVEKSVFDMEVYPNPFSNQLTIQFGGDTIQEVSLIDLNGRIVLSKLLESGTSEMELSTPSTLVDGIYFLQAINTEGQLQVSKILKMSK